MRCSNDRSEEREKKSFYFIGNLVFDVYSMPFDGRGERHFPFRVSPNSVDIAEDEVECCS